MKKLFTTLVFILALVAIPSAMSQTCNAFDAAALWASTTYLPDTADKPDGIDDLLPRLNADGSLPFGASGNYNNLEDMEMSYGADGSPRFVRRAEGWNALGDGVNATVNTIAVSGTDVYVGGDFTTAGGISANRIAKWNGSSWEALGSGVNSVVRAIAVSGADVYVGGEFTTAGGISASMIAKWNGSSWSALGSGVDSAVYSIALSGSDVYVGGNFSLSSGSAGNRIAKWNTTTSTWSALGSGTNGSVLAIVVSGSDVYVGGFFTTAGGISANRIAKWNTTTPTWSALGSGVGSGVGTIVRAIAVSDSDVYVGGDFTTAGGTSASRIAKWNGSSWSALGTGMDNIVWAIAVSGSNVYVGGQFTTAGGTSASRIAKWDGTSWSALGSGVNSTVYAIKIGNDGLYAGGDFTTAGSTMQSGTIEAESEGESSSQQMMVAANYIAYYTDAALPISLVSANATVREQTATLLWETASETNNDRFVIEQQTPQGWKQVGEVRGAGTTSQAHKYAFNVPNMSYGKHFFRIAQVDYDGSRTYSDLLSVFVELADKFALSEVYPNPFNPSTNFTLAVATDQRVEISVYDLVGRKLQTLHNGNMAGQTTHAFSINGNGLASGKYFVRVQGEQFATSKTIMLVK